MKRTFHLGDLITATTGVLVAPSGMGGFQDFVEWMTGSPVWTHQLGRAVDTCKPHLIEQFPFLADIETPDWSDLPRGDAEATVSAWLAGQVAIHGEMHEVSQLPPGAYSVGDVVAELVDMVGKDRVAVALVSEGEAPSKSGSES